jgi:hypothetical protein
MAREIPIVKLYRELPEMQYITRKFADRAARGSTPVQRADIVTSFAPQHRVAAHGLTFSEHLATRGL